MQKQIEAYIDSQRENILKDWENLVNLEGKTHEIEHLDKTVQYIYDIFTEAGVKCELHRAIDGISQVMTGIIGEDRPGKPILFAGHYDTVFHKGHFGDNPFRIEGEKAFGPGCLDMKGGIIISLYVIKALESIGYKDRPIKVTFCGDEESGGVNHKYAGQTMQDWAADCCVAFNMETGPVNNDLCTGRKSAVMGEFTVTGVSAHSGNNYEVGRNALVEAAHKIIAIQNLNDMEKGTHMNPAVIQGGTVTNVIPDSCKVTFSGRFKDQKEIDRVKAELKVLFSKPDVEGTSIEYEMVDGMPPYEETPGNIALAEYVNKVSEANGYGKVGHIYLGGGSDAAYISRNGFPVLCSCGVRGEWNHTDREYAVVESMFTRAKMWCAVAQDIDNFLATL